MRDISVRGARQHNLKNIDVEIPRNRLTVVTGLSGSGKSSLAFDTLYAEGQRRYIESLSTYARQFLEQMEKPDVDSIEGLSPAISIEQKTTGRNARSTVGTLTEVYDYLRLLFSSVGTAHCPRCGRPITPQTVERIVESIFDLALGSRIHVLAPVVRQRKGEFRKLFERFSTAGFVRARVDGTMTLLEDPPELDRRKNHTIEIVVDRLVVRDDLRPRVEESVRQASRIAGGLVTVSMVNGPETLFSRSMACVDCGISIPTLEPRSFSFNSRFGACSRCEGLGSRPQVDLERLFPDRTVPLRRLKPALNGREFLCFLRESLRALLRHHGIEETSPFDRYPERVVQALLDGMEVPIPFEYGGVRYRSRFPGLNAWFRERLEKTSSERRRQFYLSFLREGECPACGGSRLRPESRSVRISGRSIADYCRLPLDECLEAFQGMHLGKREMLVAGYVLEEIRNRLHFMNALGLRYLTLDRRAGTLSGGEAQRIRLATQIGSRLRGVLYVLDEPSIGLHSRDTRRLLDSLRELRDLGNTIIVVEHDEDTIRAADHIIDLGPGAGSQGGRIVVEGRLKRVLREESSLTAAYLSGRRAIPVPRLRRSGNGKAVALMGVRHNNLDDMDVRFPLGTFIAVTGVSGSGKSSLVDEVLYRALSRELHGSLQVPGIFSEIRGVRHLDKVIEIDQSPIGRTPRSNPATYTGLFTPIRELFALLPESRLRGYKPGRFSFNVKGGRCEVCRGDGLRKIEMNFLPDVYVVCEMCRGNRYNRETLSIKYQGYSISDVLNLTLEEALEVLGAIPRIRQKLQTMLDVGLGYIRLGQPATTLSGGEAQRVKLARELSRRSTGKTLYILDEPTTGLHFEDVRKLLDILQELVDLGNTVIVIEHNADVVKSADWIIDLGPEGGRDGGRIVFAGTPEDACRADGSHTGRVLREFLEASTRESGRTVSD